MATLNRFPLWGAFAARAALRIGYSEPEAKLLGYSTALLYAILSRRGGEGRSKKHPCTAESKAAEKPTVKIDTIPFAGMDFHCVRQNGKIAQTIVGGESQTPGQFDSQVAAKFPAETYAVLCPAFDDFLAGYSREELSGSSLYTLYATWRDACKVGFNRVDLDELQDWLRDNTREAYDALAAKTNHAVCAA